MYTPRKGKGPFPVIVYFHAGGFVVASIEVYSASAKTLADKVGAVVISVGYRLAPEHKFPTAHNDAYEAYLWAVKNAGAIKGDPKKIALAGESAGGNLAIATAIKARDEGATEPTAILAIYPIAGSDTMTASYIKYANAKPLSRPLMIWFTKKYLNNMAEAKDLRNDLLHANLKGLPQTTVITDEIDPLQSEGLALVAKLKAAGVSTASRNYNGVTHEFFGFGEIIPEAKDAETFAVDRLRKAFRP
jgi:acetyl esterase/lipase